MQKNPDTSKPPGVSKISDISGITETPVKPLKPGKNTIKPSQIGSMNANVEATADMTYDANQTMETSIDASYHHDIRPERLSRRIPNPIHQATPSLPQLPFSKFEEPQRDSVINPRRASVIEP